MSSNFAVLFRKCGGHKKIAMCLPITFACTIWTFMTRLSVALFPLIVSCFLFIVPAGAETRTILAFGDSLTAGLGLDPQFAFPAQLEQALKAKGHDVVVVNAGVSGDTAEQGLARLDWALSDDVDGVIVELGANDALRGLPPVQAEQALDDIIGKLKAKGLPVLIAGMKAPPNLGPDYVAAFDAMFPRLAAKHGVALYPFFLDGVAAEARLNQADGMHPNAEGVGVVVTRMLPLAEALVAEIMARK
jgi:acyl-CoA thioesterase I